MTRILTMVVVDCTTIASDIYGYCLPNARLCSHDFFCLRTEGRRSPRYDGRCRVCCGFGTGTAG